jgi:hypothetical protein
VHDRLDGGLRLYYLGLGFIVEREFAAAAYVVVGSELDQLAAVTSHHFPGIYRRKCGCHQVVEDARAGTSLVFPHKRSNKLGAQFRGYV